MIRIACETLHTLALEELTEFQGGLKIRDESDIEKIRKSIADYGFATPFFIWRNGATNYVLDGHGRVKALQAMQQAGEIIPPLPVVYVDCKDESTARNLLLRINSTYGLMTADTVRDFIKDLNIAIEDIRLPSGTIDLSPLEKKTQDITKRTLREQFLVPPFSVLDTRQGYWQDRKKQWKSIGIKSEEGRDNKMLSHLKKNAEKVNGTANTLTELSIFDPVLCETMYTWFCTPDGKVLDPFAGGSVRGIVASYKQMEYTGFDIRPEQIAANEKQLYICEGNKYAPRWICCFSCPPYADLETYSDIEGDISNMDYPRFMQTYREIIRKACAYLKDNRFAVFVVGEVRNKKTGAYYNFVPDTIQAFEDAGLAYYNEIILLNVAGGKAYTAGHDAKQSRKIAKVHQNILAFVKGDADKAAKIHENVLVFLKGNSKQANADLGDFVTDNCILPDLYS